MACKINVKCNINVEKETELAEAFDRLGNSTP